MKSQIVTMQNDSTQRNAAALMSLTCPSRELIQQNRALLRRAVPAGWSETQQDYIGQRRSLDEHLLQHRSNTFFMRVSGDAMRGLGIYDGDLLVVDRAAPAKHGNIVIVEVNGELQVKQLLHGEMGWVLRAAHPAYADIAMATKQEQGILGVVSWNVHAC